MSVNNLAAEQWETANLTFAARAAKKHVPLGGTFELTPRCNFNCKMCYIRMDKAKMDSLGRELTALEWIELGRQAIKEGTLNLLITGGEPLLRSDFEEIYTELTNMGFIITLNTNASLLSKEHVRLFQKYPPTATNVTLYGADRETYEKICGNPDFFDQTMHGLDLLKEIPTELEIRTTFIKDNMAQLDMIRAIANKYTKRHAINVSVFKAIRGSVSDVESCRMDPEEIFKVMESNAKYYIENSSEDEIPSEKNMETDNFSEAKDYGFELPPKILSCLAAKSTYWITWDGKMLPCGSFSHPYTLPIEEGFKAAWDRLPTLFDNIKLPEKCLKCEYAYGGCANCPALLQSETGDLCMTSDYICNTAKERAKRRKMLQKQ